MDKQPKRQAQFSKRLAWVVVIGDILLSVCTLGLCLLAVWRAYSGSLPYLTSLIGVYNAATGYVLGKYMDKSKAENTVGGIVYETAMLERDI